MATAIDFRALWKKEKSRRLEGAEAKSAELSQSPKPNDKGSSTSRSARIPGSEIVLFREPFPDVPCCVPKYQLKGIDTVYYLPEFIGKEDEAMLVEFADSSTVPWVELSRRRLQSLGLTPTKEGFDPAPMPAWGEQFIMRLMQHGVFAPQFKPNHILLNDYAKGEGIMPHTDGPRYHPNVAILSLSSTLIMQFTPRADDDKKRFELILEPRSLLVFSSSCYSDYLHGINEVLAETVGEYGETKNLASLATPMKQGDTIHRKRRLSLTVRHVVV